MTRQEEDFDSDRGDEEVRQTAQVWTLHGEPDALLDSESRSTKPHLFLEENGLP